MLIALGHTPRCEFSANLIFTSTSDFITTGVGKAKRIHISSVDTDFTGNPFTMDVKSIAPDLKKLGSNLDKLEATLQPLIDNLGDMSSELPLLDKAKLMALTAYSIESLLFCMFRSPGNDTHILTNASCSPATGRRCRQPRGHDRAEAGQAVLCQDPAHRRRSWTAQHHGQH
jgi:SAS10/Utp3/C1D family protein